MLPHQQEKHLAMQQTVVDNGQAHTCTVCSGSGVGCISLPVLTSHVWRTSHTQRLVMTPLHMLTGLVGDHDASPQVLKPKMFFRLVAANLEAYDSTDRS